MGAWALIQLNLKQPVTTVWMKPNPNGPIGLPLRPLLTSQDSQRFCSFYFNKNEIISPCTVAKQST